MARDVSGRWGDVGAAGRNSGGISGAAGKNVNPTYKTGTLATPKSGVQVIHNKQAIENAITKAQLKITGPNNSPSRPVNSPPGSGRAIKINSNPVKPK